MNDAIKPIAVLWRQQETGNTVFTGIGERCPGRTWFQVCNVYHADAINAARDEGLQGITKWVERRRETGRLEGLEEAIRICSEWHDSEAPKARLGDPAYKRGMEIAKLIEDEIRALIGDISEGRA